MADNSGRFSFFAPPVPQMDLSPITEGARAMGNAYASIGQSLAQGVTAGLQRREKLQGEKDVQAFAQKLTDPNNTDTAQYDALEATFKPALDRAASKFAADSSEAKLKGVSFSSDLETYRRNEVVDQLVNVEGYQPSQASSLYEFMKKPITGRILKPEANAALKAEALTLVARGFVSTDDLAALTADKGLFTNTEEFMQSARSQTFSLMTPMEASPGLKLRAEQESQNRDFEARLKAIEAQGKQEIGAIEARGAEERKTLGVQLSNTKDILSTEFKNKEELSKVEAELDAAKANQNFELEKQLLQRRDELQRAATKEEYDLKKALLETEAKLSSDASSAASASGEGWGKTEQRALRDLSNSLASGEDVSKDAQLLTLWGDTPAESLSALKGEINVPALTEQDKTKSAENARVYVFDNNGIPDIKVVVPNRKDAALEEALTKLTKQRLGPNAAAIVAFSQVSGGGTGSSSAIRTIADLARSGQSSEAVNYTNLAIQRSLAARKSGAPQTPPPPPANQAPQTLPPLPAGPPQTLPPLPIVPGRPALPIVPGRPPLPVVPGRPALPGSDLLTTNPNQ
jgi:hypothetical protein